MVTHTAEGPVEGHGESYIKPKALMLFSHYFTSGISVDAALRYRENRARGCVVSVHRL